jgi:hypothetical protein
MPRYEPPAHRIVADEGGPSLRRPGSGPSRPGEAPGAWAFSKAFIDHGKEVKYTSGGFEDDIYVRYYALALEDLIPSAPSGDRIGWIPALRVCIRTSDYRMVEESQGPRKR